MSSLSAYATSWRRFAQRSPTVFWSTLGLAAAVVILFVLLPSRNTDRREIPATIVEERGGPARDSENAGVGRTAVQTRRERDRSSGGSDGAGSMPADADGNRTPAEKTSPAMSQRAHPEASGGYTVQVGSFASGESARRMAAELEAAGYPAFVKAAEIPGKGPTYRVRVGAFTTREEAQSFGDRLLAREKSVKSVYATVND